MFILSFHGGSGNDDWNNLHVYDHEGKKGNPEKLLAHGNGAPELLELRGFAFQAGDVYVLNGNKAASQLLRYKPGTGGQYTFDKCVASPSTVPALAHPFDLTFDDTGNIYVSSQDTNVVTGLNSSGEPLEVASYLGQTYPKAAFLEGTQVASLVPALPRDPVTASLPFVPLPQGLAVSLADSSVAHSVRGVLWVDGGLLVADEPADSVKYYSMTGSTPGTLQVQIAGNGLSAPTHLLVNNDTLYISSSNDAVYTCPLTSLSNPTDPIPPNLWLQHRHHLSNPAGMCFDGKGNFYVALRTDKTVRQFDSAGTYQGKFIKCLHDDPEFIVFQS